MQTTDRKSAAEIEQICRDTRIEGLSFLDNEHLETLELALNALDLDREDVPARELAKFSRCRENLIDAIEGARA